MLLFYSLSLHPIKSSFEDAGSIENMMLYAQCFDFMDAVERLGIRCCHRTALAAGQLEWRPDVRCSGPEHHSFGRRLHFNLNLEIPAHKVRVIIGANGCGKSTLMKTLSRLLKPGKGQVVLDGKAVHSYPSTQLAQILGLLPQSPTVSEGITVADLVARGRYPYRKLMQNMTKEDYAAVEDTAEELSQLGGILGGFFSIYSSFAEQCACYPYIFPTIFPRATAGRSLHKRLRNLYCTPTT